MQDQDQREPYMKPAVIRLEYSQDVKVSMQGTCKTEGGGPGSAVSICSQGTCSVTS
jgi:hypothetical protein